MSLCDNTLIVLSPHISDYMTSCQHEISLLSVIICLCLCISPNIWSCQHKNTHVLFNSPFTTSSFFSFIFNFPHFQSSKIHNMPCRFVGLFYIQDSDHILSSYFLDEHAVPRTLNINYFRDIKDADSSPFPEIYINIVQSKVYMIIGSFFHRSSADPLMS